MSTIFNYLSDCNTEEEHPRMMRNLNNVESFQQRIETMNTNSISMEFIHTNVDSVVEKYGTHAPDGEIITEEFNDVTESLNQNKESLLEKELKLVNIRKETYDSSEEVDIAENNNGRSISENLHYTQVSSRENIKITSLIRDDHHEKENEVIKITDGFNNDVNVYKSESENKFDEWVIKTESNSLADNASTRIEHTEDKQSAELDPKYGRKDKASIHMETGDSNEMISK